MTVGRTATLSDPGRRRRQNEDAYVCEPPLFAVADGMGGAQAGEIASRLAAAALRDEGPDGPERGEERVISLIQEANRRVYERSSEPDKSGMGTTMTVALVEDGVVTIGHVGDSRAYLVRDGSLEQLTEDHSLVAELVRSGKLSPEEAEMHPQRSVITRALGTDPDVDVDAFSVEAHEGDLFLICSDGLTSMVADDQILKLIERNHDDLDGAARALVKAANRGGGEDNITVVCFEIAGTPVERIEETATLPAVGEAEADEEDTLSGLEAVPTIREAETIPHADDWELESRDGRSPQHHEQGPRGRRRVILLAGVLLLATLAALLVLGVSRAHFVGAESNGQVAVYQGVPWNLVGNVHLYRPVYVSPLYAAQLTPDERQTLFDHDLRRYGSALTVVRRYEHEVMP
jgi:serine/threonine protein phosphatase PrpC